MKNTNKNIIKAFTLIELAIVLVIIGLLVGGVIAGQSLIESSKANSVAVDFNKYATAYRAFYLEYDAMPGDMKNAYDYFGNLGCGPNNSSSADACNGDGNKTINWRWGAPRECNHIAWKHMHLSNLLPGVFKSDYMLIPAITIGGNFPKTSFENTTFMFCSTFTGDAPGWGGWNTTGFYGKGINKNYLTFFSTLYNPGQNYWNGPAVSAQVAQKIEEKFDDGDPDSGKMYVTKGLTAPGVYATNCVDTNYNVTSSTVQWILNTEAPDCMIHLELEQL